jgi:hypothetical protein
MNYSKRESRYKSEHNQLLIKWAKDYNNGILRIGSIQVERSGSKKNIKKKNRLVKLNEQGNPIIFEYCVVCNIQQAITPLYFNTESNNSGILNINKPSGLEQIRNGPLSGCRNCSKQKLKNKDKDEYIRILLKNYTKLSVEWYTNTPNICHISNISLIEKSNVEWRVSIQNNDNDTNHLPENCVKIAYEFNVQEHDAIPNLRECWIEAFKLFLKEIQSPSDTSSQMTELLIKWQNTVTQNGVLVSSQIIKDGKKIKNPEYSKLYNTICLQGIFNEFCNRYLRNDEKSKRDKTLLVRLTTEQLYNKLLNQKFKCYYTGIPFSFNRDTWNYFSLERIDNNLNHTCENTVFICRMFNTAGQLNKHKILKALLSQLHIPITETDKLNIEFLIYKELKYKTLIDLLCQTIVQI